jgi:hypothetical protein
VNLQTLIDIVEQVEYKDWLIRINRKDSHLFVQAVWYDEEEQLSREWFISPRMTHSDVVRTIFAMILMAEEHEVRERFRYKNRRIFGPHFDANVMVDIAGKKSNLDIAEEA